MSGGELVHRAVGDPSLESGFAREIFLVIVANVGPGHVLMAETGDALANPGVLGWTCFAAERRDLRDSGLSFR